MRAKTGLWRVGCRPFGRAFLSCVLFSCFVLCCFAGSAQGAGAQAAAGERVRDRLWIWGHAAGIYNDNFLKNVPRESRIEPVDAARYMGLSNMMFVRYDGRPQPPFDGYFKPFRRLDNVVWSLTGAGGATSAEERQHVLQLAADHDNVTGFILDDFFRGHMTGSADLDAAANPPFEASLSPAELAEIRKRLRIRNRQLPLIAVVYTGQISPKAKAHLDEIDKITLWTWEPAELRNLESNLASLEKLVAEKPILLGCYMFDFSASRPLTVEAMRRQSEVGLRWLRQGRIEGIVVLATPVCDLDLDAVEWTRRWIAQVGDEPLMP